MNKKILSYGMANERLNKLLEIASEEGIEIIIAKDEDLGQKTGYLLGMEGFEKEESPTPSHIDTEYILLKGFTNEDLNYFLQRQREENLIVPHKSVLTDNSKNWTLGYLIDHIMGEHKVMMIWEKLKQLVKIATEVQNLKKDDKLEELLEGATNVLKDRNMTEESLREAYNNLYVYLEKMEG